MADVRSGGGTPDHRAPSSGANSGDEALPAGGEEVVTIVVRGEAFKLPISDLHRYPDTMLGAMFADSNAPLRRGRSMVVFDRNVDVFRAVARLYRDGEWSMPAQVKPVTLFRELDFWQAYPPWPSGLCDSDEAELHGDMSFLCERLRAITYVKTSVLRQISRGDLLGCRLVGSFLTPLNQTQEVFEHMEEVLLHYEAENPSHSAAQALEHLKSRSVSGWQILFNSVCALIEFCVANGIPEESWADSTATAGAAPGSGDGGGEGMDHAGSGRSGGVAGVGTASGGAVPPSRNMAELPVHIPRMLLPYALATIRINRRLAFLPAYQHLLQRHLAREGFAVHVHAEYPPRVPGLSFAQIEDEYTPPLPYAWVKLELWPETIKRDCIFYDVLSAAEKRALAHRPGRGGGSGSGSGGGGGRGSTGNHGHRVAGGGGGRDGGRGGGRHHGGGGAGGGGGALEHGAVFADAGGGGGGGGGMLMDEEEEGGNGHLGQVPGGGGGGGAPSVETTTHAYRVLYIDVWLLDH